MVIATDQSEGEIVRRGVGGDPGESEWYSIHFKKHFPAKRGATRRNPIFFQFFEIVNPIKKLKTWGLPFLQKYLLVEW